MSIEEMVKDFWENQTPDLRRPGHYYIDIRSKLFPGFFYRVESNGRISTLNDSKGNFPVEYWCIFMRGTIYQDTEIGRMVKAYTIVQQLLADERHFRDITNHQAARTIYDSRYGGPLDFRWALPTFHDGI